jgi:hypothetical protein
MLTGPVSQAATAGRRAAIGVRRLRKSFGAVFGWSFGAVFGWSFGAEFGWSFGAVFAWSFGAVFGWSFGAVFGWLAVARYRKS